MRRYLLSVGLLLFSATFALAQGPRYEVSGTVVDTTQAGMGGATVLVMEVDSTLISFGITRPDGRFRLDRVPAGELVLQVTFVGFEQHTRPITLSDQPLDVGTIVLRESLAELEELVVTADHVPLLVRRDTLDYNASAFRVPPNANVEALLRRLPGIEIDHDGTIRAQGEAVRRVLVDGREFFGNDPTVATRNLPADAVARVQVYDRKSDTAELTGVDDGNQERTINLELKEDRRTGSFGNLTGGAGDPRRFETRGSVNRFSTNTQISVIGNANNINQQGFQHNDFSTFMGDSGQSPFGQRLAPISRGQSDGFSTTMSGGLNFSRDFGASTSLRTSYVGYYLDREQDTVSLQRELAEGQSAALVSDNTDSGSRQFNHRLQVNARHEFEEGHDLRLESNASLGENTSESLRLRITERPEGEAQNTSTRRYDWTSNTLAADARLTYRRRLAPGRTIVAEVGTEINDQQFDTDLEAATSFFRDGNLLTSKETRQIQDQNRSILNHSQKLTYTEPLGRRQLLEFEVQHRAALEARDYATFDLIDGAPVPNLPQSLVFDRTYRYLRGGTTFRRSVEPLTVSVGAVVQRADLLGETLGQDANLDRQFTRVLPSASLRYAFSQSNYVQVSYTSSTREPSMRDLQPFLDSADPLNRFIGNPNLRPSYQHVAMANYVFFDQFTGTNIFANARFLYQSDAIVRSRTVDEDLREISTVVNADGDWSLNLWANVGRLIRSLGARGSVNGGPTFSRGIEFLNDEANVSRIIRTPVSLTVDNINKETVDVRAVITFTFNDVSYTLNPALNRSYLNRTLSGSVEYQFAEGWRAGSGIDYNLYSAEVFGEARQVPIVQAHVSWLVPQTRAELRLEGHDLLNQNLGVTYSSTASHIREQRTASLGRFMMLKMVYNLSGQPATRPGRVMRAGA